MCASLTHCDCQHHQQGKKRRIGCKWGVKERRVGTQHQQDDDEQEIHIGQPSELLKEGLGNEAQQRVLGSRDGIVAKRQPIVVVSMMTLLGEGDLCTYDMSTCSKRET